MAEYTDLTDRILSVTAESFDVGKRVDAFIAEKTQLTRSAAARLIENGNVLLGRKEIAKNYKLRAGDIFEIELPEPEDS